MLLGYVVVDISNLKNEPDTTIETSNIDLRYVKISFPNNNAYTRVKSSGVLTPLNLTELYLRGLDIESEGLYVPYAIVKNGEASIDGILCTDTELAYFLRSDVKDTRSDIKIKSELIIDLGSIKSVSKIKAILGKFDNNMKYESEYSVHYSKDNINYKLLYTSAPTDVSTEEYTNMSQKLVVLPEILDTRYVDTFDNGGSSGSGSGSGG